MGHSPGDVPRALGTANPLATHATRVPPSPTGACHHGMVVLDQITNRSRDLRTGEKEADTKDHTEHGTTRPESDVHGRDTGFHGRKGSECLPPYFVGSHPCPCSSSPC